MSVEPAHDGTSTNGIGRFLRGKIIQRFLGASEHRESRGTMESLLGVPITVTFTDGVTELTTTIPAETGEVTTRVASFTDTIPVITVSLTETITRGL